MATRGGSAPLRVAIAIRRDPPSAALSPRGGVALLVHPCGDCTTAAGTGAGFLIAPGIARLSDFLLWEGLCRAIHNLMCRSSGRCLRRHPDFAHGAAFWGLPEGSCRPRAQSVAPIHPVTDTG